MSTVSAVPTASPAAPATVAAPSGDRTEPQPPHGRIVNGHVFQPSAIAPGALITTSFGSSMVLGIGSTTSNITVGDRVFSGNLDYAGIGGNIGYEYAFLDWLSARINLIETIYSGINGKSALTVGTEVRGGATLGATASIPVGETLRVGVLLDAGVQPGLALTIGHGIQEVINSCRAGDCTVDTGNTFSSGNSVIVQPALAANWAPSRAFGVTANFSYLHVSLDQNDETVTSQAAVLAGALDYDLRAVSSIPVALQLSFGWTAPFSGSGLQHITDVGGGLFYTGRDHLSAGVQFVVRRFAVNPDLDVSWSTTLATVGLRYYW